MDKKLNIEKLQSEYDDAMAKLKQIEEKIINSDCSIIDNKVFKNCEKSYYLEFMVFAETKYESSGFYTLNQYFAKIEGDIYPLLKDIIEKRDDKALNSFARKLFIIDEVTNEEHKIINKYSDKFYKTLEEYNWYHFDDDEINIYQNEDDENNIFDIYFKNEYSGSHGYVSLIQTDEDLSDKDKEFEIKKYYTEN